MATALNLYKRHAKAELLAMQQAISDNQANRQEGGLFIHTEPARKKLSAVASAITMHMEDERAAAGRPVPTCGYSGRQTNRLK